MVNAAPRRGAAQALPRRFRGRDPTASEDIEACSQQVGDRAYEVVRARAEREELGVRKEIAVRKDIRHHMFEHVVHM